MMEGRAARRNEIAALLRTSATNRRLEDKRLSIPGSLAASMLADGRNLLTEAGDRTGSTSNVAPDMATWFFSLPSDMQPRVLRGLGLVFVGSIVSSIEIGLVDGWDDGIYLSLFNEHTRGIPIAQETIEHLQTLPGFIHHSAQEETEALRKTAKLDGKGTFAIFLKDTLNMPNVVRTHVENRHPLILGGIMEAVRIYSDALKMMRPASVSPEVSEPAPAVDRQAFLASIDGILGGDRLHPVKDVNRQADELLKDMPDFSPDDKPGE